MLKWLRGKKTEQPDLLTELTIVQVQEIQSKHSDWLESQMKNGHKANFEKCMLPISARFGGNYEGVSFRGSYLRGIIFKGANLLFCDFREANLQDTDFNGTEGLNIESISGADVTNSKLPEDIKHFGTLDVLHEAAKNARRLFLVMLLACLYSGLTIAATTDVSLLTNSASSPLPIIGAEIPIVGFYWALPLFLIGIYIYFHLSMLRMWEGLAKLPAIFPDGIPLDQKINPWLLLGLVRNHLSLLKKIRPRLHMLQTMVSSLLAWWVVPLTLILFWLRFLPRHDWLGTGLHIILLGFTAWFGTLSRWLTTDILEEKGAILRKTIWKSGFPQGAIAISLFLLVSIGAIEGLPPNYKYPNDIRRWVPRALEYMAYGAFVDFEEVDVSIKPSDWTGNDSTQAVLLRGAMLRNQDLRYLKANGAFLVKADLSQCNLEGADLSGADLRYANLRGANLRFANLEGANLQGADISESDLRDCYLVGADLNHANFELADLRNANLRHSNLKESDFFLASLVNADLVGADLRGAVLFFSSLDGANFTHADLRGASMGGDLFSGWKIDNMWGANILNLDASQDFISWAIDSMHAVEASTDDEYNLMIEPIRGFQPPYITKDYELP